jgi:hypothetical protein
MPRQYDGLFVEYSLVCQKEENKISTKKHCFANQQKYFIPENEKKEKNQFCYLKILTNFEA